MTLLHPSSLPLSCRRPLPLLVLPVFLLIIAPAHAASSPSPSSPTPPPTRATVNDDSASVPYIAPNVKDEELIFRETFQGSPYDNHWVHVKNPRYSGKFEVGTGKKPAFKGDKGLIIPEKAKFYGISAPFESGELKDKPIVFQFEVKHEEGNTCGGAYLKFIPAPFQDFESWGSDVPYSVMFGPDKCGTDDRVHFIMQTKNPNGKFIEHHMKNPVKTGGATSWTHLYTLAIYPDATFEIYVDNVKKWKGSLKDDMQPPIQPPQEIDDPDDEKPHTWVDESQIPDPDAVKPDTWDENQPMKIPDPLATKPSSWYDDENDMIPDPSASKPDEWDEDEDGQWEPPLIPNPKCEKAGCGVWKPPMIDNPKYKGKWSPPLIDNPAYIGEWKPRKIPNPDYYKVDDFSPLPISGVGIEIWTMDFGFLFDNIYVTRSLEAAQQFSAQTFDIKKEVERRIAKELRGDVSSPAAKVLNTLRNILDETESNLAPLRIKLEALGLEDLILKVEAMGVKTPLSVIALVPALLMIVTLLILLIVMSGGRKEKPVTTTPAPEKKDDNIITPDDPPASVLTAADQSDEAMTSSEVSSTITESDTGVRKRIKKAD